MEPMRNPERFNKFVLPKLIEQFPLRLQKDLQTIKWPDKITGTIESTFIYGPANYGKTVTAAFMLLQEKKNLYMDNNVERKDCLFVSVPDIFYELKSTFSDKEKTEYQIVEKYRNAHLLVLDDIGVKNPSDWGLEILYLIINHRYDWMKKTVITSNLSLVELAETFRDNRITSRIERMCGKIIEKRNWRK